MEVAVIKPLRQPLLPDLGGVPRVACVALQRQLLVDAAGVALEVNRVRVNVALCREAAELADAQPAGGEDRRVAGRHGGRVSSVGDVVHKATTGCGAWRKSPFTAWLLPSSGEPQAEFARVPQQAWQQAQAMSAYISASTHALTISV